MAQLAGVPRRVKVLVLVTAVLVLLAVLAVVTGVGGEHGPGRHLGRSPGSASHGVPLVSPTGRNDARTGL